VGALHRLNELQCGSGCFEWGGMKKGVGFKWVMNEPPGLGGPLPPGAGGGPAQIK